MIRRLRNLREIKNFRAHEFRAFFLYYGPHILEGLVDEDDLEVTKHLNSIIYLSNKEVVDHNLVEILNEEVVQFLEKFNESFGEEHLTINFHELIHLPQNIAFNGSGYAISCFEYENLNNHMKKWFMELATLPSKYLKTMSSFKILFAHSTQKPPSTQ